MEPTKVTPMMQQYLQIKERHRDAILFFRLGDFYEMFFEDAQTASKILDIALTARNKSDDGSVPLCGVPYHSAEPYIQKLLDAGHKVAVCEQVEDPALAKGVVKREVVRVITPGTVTAVEALDARGNNFLCAVHRSDQKFGLALSDITTGEFRATEATDWELLLAEVSRIKPSELLLAESERALADKLRREFPAVHMTPVPDVTFSPAAGARVAATAPAGDYAGVGAASAILAYLDRNAGESLKLLRELELYAVANHLILDESTRVNLELIANYSGDRKGSLLAVIDRTLTPMGARRLRQWLLYPLLDERAIAARHESLQELVDNFGLREDLQQSLAAMQDLERLAGRTLAGSASPKDLVAIKQTLASLDGVRQALAAVNAPLLVELRGGLQPLPQISDLVSRAIIDDPPFVIKDGGFIRAGFDPELDEIRGARSHAKEWMATFEADERRRTGIQSLKVRYNRIFGYYIEITNANLKSVPGNYIRKQTMATGERYYTAELKEYEAKVLNSEELIGRIEAELLAKVREQVAAHYPALKQMSAALATLDSLLSLARVAESERFCRPRVDASQSLWLREARHPVVEASVGRGAFVPNDCSLESDTQQIIMLTGPNMAGKSTYMRQVALLVILAQMGSFVPASEARVGIVDRIFTRIGAADSLARGESTFMVEMKETANILHHATERSLIVLDEVGRGTSTFDGISIAWAVAESLHDAPARPRTLFATHYHELTELARACPRVKNFNFAVKEWQGDIIFLRNLIEGAASHSYGIHVARLAGLPAPVIARAKDILARLEGDAAGREALPLAAEPAEKSEPVQMALFAAGDSKLRAALRRVDVSTMTPIEALNLLHRLSEEVKK